ncbi:DUF4871 domain-containing protein [Bacillus tianshenii]|nr:DUF4871 domain-containing protein [Bacillus tianshenii]
MMMTILLLSSMILSGCAAQATQPNDWNETESFTAEGKQSYELKGHEGEIAFLDSGEFVANEPKQTKWFFWNNEDVKVKKQNFKLVGIQKLDGKKEKLLVHKNNAKVWATEIQEASKSRNIGTTIQSIISADASQPVLMSFPSPGLWKLKAYVNDKLYGTIIVDVKQRK